MFIIEKLEISEIQKEIVKYHQILTSTGSLLIFWFTVFQTFYFCVAAYVIFIIFYHFSIKIYHGKVVGSLFKSFISRMSLFPPVFQPDYFLVFSFIITPKVLDSGNSVT